MRYPPYLQGSVQCKENVPGVALPVDEYGDEDNEGQGDDGHGDGQDQQQCVLVRPV